MLITLQYCSGFCHSNVFKIFNLFRLCWVFIAVSRFSLAVVSRCYTLVVMHGLLITAASLVSEHRF